MKSYLALLGHLVLLSGCATAINVADFRELDIDRKDAAIKPPEYVINKKKPRIALLPVEDATQFEGKLAKSAYESLTQAFSSGAGLQVVERSQMQGLLNEAKFAESMGVDTDYSKFTNYAQDIDFVLAGSITSAGATATFTEASSWTDKKGKTYYSPASCLVKGEVIVNVRSISTSTGSIQKVFRPFKGTVRKSTEVRHSSDCTANNSEQLVTAALNKAIEAARDDFIDAFPNYGYISKTMTNPKEPKARIAYISLGKNDGLKAGDKITVGKFVKTVDRIKKSESIGIQDLGEAVINETGLSDEESIIAIPEEISNEIVPGYVVKTKVNRDILKTLGAVLTY